MRYLFYQKSYCEMSDTEKVAETENIIEAAKVFCKRISISPYYCNCPAGDLFRNISCLEKEKPKPFEDKIIEELLSEIRKHEESEWKMRKEKNDKNELILKLQKYLADKGLFEEIIDYLNKGKEK